MSIIQDVKYLDNGEYSVLNQPKALVPKEIKDFINILFTNSRAGTKPVSRDANDLFKLVLDTELSSYLTESIGYIFTTDDSSLSFNSLVELENLLITEDGLVEGILRFYRDIMRHTDKDKQTAEALISIFSNHYNTVYRLSALLILHVLVLYKLYNAN